MSWGKRKFCMFLPRHILFLICGSIGERDHVYSYFPEFQKQTKDDMPVIWNVFTVVAVKHVPEFAISKRNVWTDNVKGSYHADYKWRNYRSIAGLITLTLSQWSSSGNPVAIQCAWNLDPSVHWNATGEIPVVFQWSSSGFPVVFQCVPIMQINTGSPLGHHWVQASASVVPVASQCTCGSSGLPVCSNYAN